MITKQNFTGSYSEWKAKVLEIYPKANIKASSGVFGTLGITDAFVGKDRVGGYGSNNNVGWIAIDDEKPVKKRVAKASVLEPIENCILKAMENKTFPRVAVSKQYPEETIVDFGKKYNLVYAGEDGKNYFFHSGFITKELSEKEEAFLYVILNNNGSDVPKLMEIACKELNINKLSAAGILSGLNKKGYYSKDKLLSKGVSWLLEHQNINKNIADKLRG